jgi:predicted enzyme related to lactoylglutathione lyase
MKIGMTGIFVNEVAQAFKFYTEVLGFEQRVYIPEMNLAVVVAKGDPNGTSLLLGPNDNPIGKDFQTGLYQSGIPTIVMTSDDIQHEYETLAAKGVVFRKAPVKTQWGTEAIFEDTCGNLIQLHQLA